MSMGPLTGAGGVAGAPLAQTKGSELERVGQDAAAQARRLRSQTQAADAAGIGATSGEESRPEDRDADGRRLWEFSERAEGEASAAPVIPKGPRDPLGECGTQLDLSG